jgi:hypothetical protein
MSLTAEALLDVLQGALSDQGVQLARLQANYNKSQKKQRRPENKQGGQAGTGKKKSRSKHNKRPVRAAELRTSPFSFQHADGAGTE